MELSHRLIARVRGRSFLALRVLVQSRRELRSHRRVLLHRQRRARAQDQASPARVAMTARVQAVPATIAHVAARKASAGR
jgi:hypothetical protein